MYKICLPMAALLWGLSCSGTKTVQPVISDSQPPQSTEVPIKLAPRVVTQNDPVWSHPDDFPAGATKRIGTKSFVATGKTIAISNEGRVLTSYDGKGIVEYRPDGEWRVLIPHVSIVAARYKNDGSIVVLSTEKLFFVSSDGDVETQTLTRCNRSALSVDLKYFACATETEKKKSVSVFLTGAADPIHTVAIMRGAYIEQLVVANTGELVVLTDDRFSTVFDDKGKPLWTREKTPTIDSFAVDETKSELLAFLRNDDDFHRFDLRTGKRLKPTFEKMENGQDTYPTGYTFRVENETIAFPLTRNNDKYLGVFWTEDRKIEWPSDQYIHDFSFSPDGKLGGFIDRVGVVTVGDFETGKRKFYGSPPRETAGMRLFDSGTKLLVADSNGHVELINVQTDRRIAESNIGNQISSPVQIKSSDDGSLVSFTNKYGMLKLFTMNPFVEICSTENAPAFETFFHDGYFITIGGGFDDWLFAGELNVHDRNCKRVTSVKKHGGIQSVGPPKNGMIDVQIDDATYDKSPEKSEVYRIDLKTGKLKLIKKKPGEHRFTYDAPEELRERDHVFWTESRSNRIAWLEYRDKDSRYSLHIADATTLKNEIVYDAPQTINDLTIADDGKTIAVDDAGTILLYPAK